MGIDPSALGARPTTIGSNAGRQMRGAMAQAAAQHTPSMGLSGMRAPRSAAQSLSGAQPMARPVKAPIGGMKPMVPGATLPQPIMPKVVRQPIVQQPVSPPVVQTPMALAPEVIPEPEKIVQEPVLEIKGLQVEETMDDILEEALEESMVDEIKEVQEPVLLTPIKKLGVVIEPKTAVLKPVTVNVLTPVSRRGPPPSSAPGIKPGEKAGKEATAVLKPIEKLNPVSTPSMTLNIASGDEEE